MIPFFASPNATHPLAHREACPGCSLRHIPANYFPGPEKIATMMSLPWLERRFFWGLDREMHSGKQFSRELAHHV